MNLEHLRKAMQILIVDDNPDDVELFRLALAEGNGDHVLSVARDGVEAMAFLRREGPFQDAPWPDLILLDLNMPRKDGREVLAEVKSDPDLRRIPIIVLTSSKSPEDVLKVYALQANCYIPKPVDFVQYLSMAKAIENFWFGIARLPGTVS
jgi:CheY-like chemotaxis protein